LSIINCNFLLDRKEFVGIIYFEWYDFGYEASRDRLARVRDTIIGMTRRFEWSTMRLSVNDSSLPKYVQLRDGFIAAIESGELREGDQLPTEDTLVQELSVSRNTIRRAVDELFQMGMVVRRQGSGTFVRAGWDGRHARGESLTDVIGVLVRDIASPDDVYPDIIRGIQDVSGQHDHHVILANTDDQWDKMTQSMTRFLRIGVSGVIISPVIQIPGLTTREFRQFRKQRLDMYSGFQEAGIPVVLINRQVPGVELPCVKSDNVLGGYMATRHLLKEGHTLIGAVFPPPYSTVKDRERGYRKALAEEGISPRDGFIQYACLDDPDPVKTMVDSLMDRQPEPPTAIFAFTDDLAARVFECLQEKGIQVPDDVALVGYNDCRIAVSLSVQLTSVAYPKYEIGRKAAELLLDGSGKKPSAECIVLPPRLVVRASSVSSGESSDAKLASASTSAA
jgi:GntR family transcriptional regulator of arabinose operon